MPRRLAFVATLAALLVLAGCGGDSAPDRPAGVPASAAPADVVRIVDGDTFVVSIDGRQETVRMIGVDTPEVKDTRAPAACYADEAKSRTTDLLTDRTVWLEVDTRDRDDFDRLLRYVWLGVDGSAMLVNEALVAEGLGVARRYPPDTREAPRLETAMDAARATGAGLWSACGGFDVQEPVAIPTVAAGASVPGAPAGWTGGDLDCGDFGAQRQAQQFYEAQGGPAVDPHGLDSDGNGRVCESLP